MVITTEYGDVRISGRFEKATADILRKLFLQKKWKILSEKDEKLLENDHSCSEVVIIDQDIPTPIMSITELNEVIECLMEDQANKEEGKTNGRLRFPRPILVLSRDKIVYLLSRRYKQLMPVLSIEDMAYEIEKMLKESAESAK